ncbi:MAG TPA: MnhB domain-containing protein [Egibacteraceae bacterium]|nr:MnhB domain-containing protein [Egibacteraceae bacterium]
MSPSLILSTITRVISPTVWVFSLWLLASGHNAPGGGFIGGLVASAALVLAYATGGEPQVRRIVPLPSEAILGVGLLMAQGTTMASWLWGGQALESRVFDLHLPLFGDVHVVTPLFFDIGVYLVVVGLVAKILTTLGAQQVEP